MFATPDEAEAAFYTAFANTNVEAMMKVWMTSDAVVCVHPVRPKVTGHQAVRAAWTEMFHEGTSLRFRLAEVSRTQDALLAVHVLNEYISVPGESTERQPMVATNIYQLTQNGWRMILHHASPIAVQPPMEKPQGRLH
jgi:uncharacterized protein (TIGR02246 family)